LKVAGNLEANWVGGGLSSTVREVGP